MRKILVSVCSIGIGLMATPSAAEQGSTPDQEFFSSDETLEVIIETDLDALTRDRKGKRPSPHPGVMIIGGEGGARQRLEVSLTVRGISRLEMGICRFPQLFVRFDPETAAGTSFAGRHVMPLVTHCRNGKKYEQFLLQEYLAYRTYGLLTDASVRTRLVRATYRDSTGERKEFARYAFFLEHFDDVAARLGRKPVRLEDFHPGDADTRATAIMNVFQYMIGNTDWSLVKQHNVVLLSGTGGAVIPLPFDFDWTGVVDASYAYPGDEVSINSVRQRLYRGACLPEPVMLEVFDHFLQSREAIYALYRNQEGLDERQKKKSLQYYDAFYETVASAGQRRKKILAACHHYQRGRS